MNIHQHLIEKLSVYNYEIVSFLLNNIDFLILNFLENQTLQFIVLISFLILLGLGFSNTVIIFNDGLDFFQTLGIIIVPVVGYLFVMWTIPSNANSYVTNMHFEEKVKWLFPKTGCMASREKCTRLVFLGKFECSKT